MKRLIILNTLIFFSILAYGQESISVQKIDTVKKEKIQFNLPGPALRLQISNLFKRSIQFDFEVPTSPRNSLVFTPSATVYEASDEKAYGGGLTIAYRKYSHLNLFTSKKWDGGLYISLKAGYNYLSLSSTSVTSDYDYLTNGYDTETTVIEGHIHQMFFGGGLGIQFIISKTISIDTSIGSTLRYSIGKNEELINAMTPLNILYNGFAPFMRVGIGIINKK